MATEKKKNGDSIHDQLTQLETQGIVPYVIREANTPQKRWQWGEYPSGVHYASPMDPEPLGRYNDPTGQTGICYTADYAAAAIAESLGRVYQRDQEAFTLGLSDLQKAQMYTLETTRETKTINMPRLQGMLHFTSDQMMGNDPSITQSVADWAANTPGLPYDGISYRSRHYDVGMCTAYWEREGKSGPLVDVTHSPVDSYVDSDAENFPQNWSEENITGFEIVVETLRFDVSADDS
ncbi:RES domain-containing protein [Xenorhabdus bovienii]|uniref:RES domain-containing protein n=1 Tax=Xenorhabdus bovienii TaxID=40576 RepID=UPI00237CF820|nr:RES domain-containing protein [Xenorhabdus bovienii]MDE1497406.1 RES domain-containing protein [Xenorhabdus bovienii]MDE9472472.1 RES domain-containing protein [Xenorhabdus bovienii]